MRWASALLHGTVQEQSSIRRCSVGGCSFDEVNDLGIVCLPQLLWSRVSQGTEALDHCEDHLVWRGCSCGNTDSLNALNQPGIYVIWPFD